MSSARGPTTTALGYAGTGNVEIALDGGLDLKTNPHVLQPPKTTVCDNALLSNQGQVKQLPGVTAADSLTKVYTGTAVPNIEPYVRGAYLSVSENKHIFETGTASSTPMVNLGNTDSLVQKPPLAPCYPLTVSTRAFIGNSGIPNDGNTTALPQPVSAQGSVLGNVDTSKVLVTVQTYDTSRTKVAGVYVSDLTGNTTAQFARTLETGTTNFKLGQYALINDPTSPLRFYLVGTGGTTPAGIYYYTILLNNGSGADPIVSITKTSIDTTLTNTTRFMCCIYQGYVLVIYGNGTNLKAATITGGTLASNVNISADFNVSSSNLAAFTSSNRVFVAQGGSLRIFTTTGSGPVFSFTQQQAVNIDPTSYGANATTGIYSAVNGGNITIFSRVMESYTSGQTSAAGYPAVATAIAQVMTTQMSYDGTNVSNVRNQFFRSEVGCAIRTKAFLLYNGNKGMVDSGSALCAIALGSKYFSGGTFLSSSFLIDHNCQVVSRFNDNGGDLNNITNDTSVGLPIARGITEVYWLSEPNNANLFEIGLPFLSTIVTGGNTNYTTPASGSNAVNSLPPYILGWSINLCNIAYQAQGAVITPARCGKSLLMNGALTMEYDSRTLHESGFHFQASPPSPPTIVSTGPNAAGTYYYYTVYRWTDANGQLHQSAPSPARAVTFSSTWASADFYIWPPIHTYKSFDSTLPNYPAAPVWADLYRSSTASNDPTGAVAYLVGTLPLDNFQHGPTNVNYLSASHIYDDKLTTIKTSAPPLYTTSQVATNAPPSFIYTVNSKGRCFGLAQVGSTYRVYFSSPYSDVPFNFASRWNINGFLTVPPELGDCRSLAALDDKILIFGTQGVAVFAGDGPSVYDKTGSFNYADNPAQLGFSAVIPLPIPLGTVGCGAPVTIPNGVLYQDRQGIMQIDRSLQPSFVGGGVDSLTNINRYGRPYLHPTYNSVVFPNSKGSALVYAFDLQRFSQWPALQNSVGIFQIANGATFSIGTNLSNGFVDSNSKVYQVRDSNFTQPLLDQVTLPTLILETPWIQIGPGFGGEGDIWESLVTGQYFAPHQLQLEVAYDYGNYELPQVVSYLTGSTIPQVPYQSKFRPPRRARAQVIRYRLSVVPETASKAAECARITGVTMYAGMYRATQRVGAGVSR